MASILVVDDERAIRNSLKEILEYEDYKVEVAENGAEALQKVQTGKFDLIFSDIKMPEMDGITFLEAVLNERGDLPIVIMSSFSIIVYKSYAPILSEKLVFVQNYGQLYIKHL